MLTWYYLLLFTTTTTIYYLYIELTGEEVEQLGLMPPEQCQPILGCHTSRVPKYRIQDILGDYNENPKTNIADIT